MKRIVYLLLVVALLAGFVLAAPASAGDVTVSCQIQTLSWELVKDWTFHYLNVEVETVQAVVMLKYVVYPVGDRHVIDFDITYITFSGQTVLASGQIVLNDSCTGFETPNASFICSTANVEESFSEVVARGRLGHLWVSYEDWYVGIFIRGNGVGLHFEEWELHAMWLTYLLTLNIDITTATTTCNGYVGPGGQEMLLWTYNDGGNVAEFAGNPVSYYMVDTFGTEHFINSGVVGPFGDISIIVPPGHYPSNAEYGEWNVVDGLGNQMLIVPSRMFVARVNGFIVETVIQGPSEPDYPVTTYVVLGQSDTVNLHLRSSTPNAVAWQ